MTESPYRHISFSNALSYGSLCCGLAAIFAARDSASWEAAGLFLALSALADTFDGRFARRFNAPRLLTPSACNSIVWWMLSVSAPHRWCV